MVKRKHIPVMMVSGFLGSGKTTLVNRLLTKTKGTRFAMIVNEFGEIGLDGHLIKATDFVKMDNGCLCCVMNEDLIKTIKNLSKRDDYDVVLLETTGVADPLPIAWPFLKPDYKDKFRFAGIITVVDALHLQDMLQKASETRLQIERADYIYMSKTDLVNETELTRVLTAVAEINNNARVVLATDSQWRELLFDVNCHPERSEGSPDCGEGRRSFARAQDDSRGFVSVEHDHKSEFDAVSFLLSKSVDLSAAEDFFGELPHTVYRAKAVFKTADGKIYAMHAVCGRVDFYELTKFNGQFAAVFIGKNIEEEELKTRAKICLNI